MALDKRLIMDQARSLHGLELTEQRADELAREIQALCEGGARLWEMARFEDDALDFLSALYRMGEPR